MAEEKKAVQANAPAKAVEAVKKDDVKPGFFKRVGKWFREMKSELKKVVWPTKKEVGNNTLVTLFMIVISALFLWGFDALAQGGVQLLLQFSTH
jgi:preprotein translocase subunit SecE